MSLPSAPADGAPANPRNIKASTVRPTPSLRIIDSRIDSRSADMKRTPLEMGHLGLSRQPRGRFFGGVGFSLGVRTLKQPDTPRRLGFVAREDCAFALDTLFEGFLAWRATARSRLLE